MWSSLWPRLSVVLCTFTLVACTKDVVDDTDTGQSDETGGIDDSICEYDDPYLCECLNWGAEWVFAGIVYGPYDTAVTACFSECHEQFGAGIVQDTKITPVVCAEVPQMLDCSDWTPARAVNVEQSGVYAVDRTLIEALVLDPEPLSACDDATVMRVLSGGYQVAGADPCELLHELGLRNGDVLLSLNHYPLGTASEVAVAFTELWSSGTSVFELELRRGGYLHILRYRLSAP